MDDDTARVCWWWPRSVSDTTIIMGAGTGLSLAVVVVVVDDAIRILGVVVVVAEAEDDTNVASTTVVPPGCGEWWVEDDDVLRILGSCCACTRELDIKKNKGNVMVHVVAAVMIPTRRMVAILLVDAAVVAVAETFVPPPWFQR